MGFDLFLDLKAALLASCPPYPANPIFFLQCTHFIRIPVLSKNTHYVANVYPLWFPQGRLILGQVFCLDHLKIDQKISFFHFIAFLQSSPCQKPDSSSILSIFGKNNFKGIIKQWRVFNRSRVQCKKIWLNGFNPTKRLKILGWSWFWANFMKPGTPMKCLRSESFVSLLKKSIQFSGSEFQLSSWCRWFTLFALLH